MCRRAVSCLVFVGVALAAVFGCEPLPFHCQQDAQCVLDMVAGRCESDGFCSFPDGDCPSWRRYGEHAPAGIQNSCVSSCVTDVALGARHGCLLREDGLVMCWGDSLDQKLGPGLAGQQRVVPTLVKGLDDVRAVAAGSDHSCVIVGDDRGVACWGKNAAGQLGKGPSLSQATPVTVTYHGKTRLQAVQVEGGAEHTCARTNVEGEKLLCWGQNSACQLGKCMAGVGTQVVVSAPSSSIRALAIGGEGSCSRFDDGEALCWGKQVPQQQPQCSGPPLAEGYTQLLPAGMVSALGRSAAQLCTAAGSALRCCGNAPLSDTLPAAITTIAPGDSHVCVLAAGRVYCAGNNQYGQLGQGHDQAETAMVQVALLPPISKLVTRRNTSCALSEQGVLYCWGANDQGQANPYAGALTVSAPSSALMQGIVCGVSL